MAARASARSLRKRHRLKLDRLVQSYYKMANVVGNGIAHRFSTRS